MVFSFEEYLKKKNLSQNTIKSYLFTVNQYQSKYLIISLSIFSFKNVRTTNETKTRFNRFNSSIR